MNKFITLSITIILLGLLGILLGVFIGPSKIGAGEFIDAIMFKSSVANNTIIWDIRLPRIFIAISVGSSFAVAGVILQTTTRNPLGDPQLFGITGGALIVQALIITGLIDATPWLNTILSVLASIICSILIYIFASRETFKPATLALIGFSVGAMCLAISTAIMAYQRVFTQQALGVIGGSTANIAWSSYIPMIPFMFIGLFFILSISYRLNILSLGNTIIRNVGVNPNRIRLLSMIFAGVLSGSAVSVVGTVGLLGLIAAHISRIIMGNDVRKVVVFAIPVGSLLMLYVDQISRLIFMPNEVPVGLVISIIGAPIMIYLAWRHL